MLLLLSIHNIDDGEHYVDYEDDGNDGDEDGNSFLLRVVPAMKSFLLLKSCISFVTTEGNKVTVLLMKY